VLDPGGRPDQGRGRRPLSTADVLSFVCHSDAPLSGEKGGGEETRLALIFNVPPTQAFSWLSSQCSCSFLV